MKYGHLFDWQWSVAWHFCDTMWCVVVGAGCGATSRPKQRSVWCTVVCIEHCTAQARTVCSLKERLVGKHFQVMSILSSLSWYSVTTDH